MVVCEHLQSNIKTQNRMADLLYPTIDLFLYDFIDGLGDKPEEIEVSKQLFSEKLPKDMRVKLQYPDDYEDNEFVYLFPNSPDHVESFGDDGYYYPVCLGDSYGLLIDCSLNNKTDIQSAEIFRDIKLEIEQRSQNIQATIGQTWMMSGWLPSSSNKSPEEVAQACYQALFPDANWSQDFDGKGQFLGSNIFELSRFHSRNRQHVIIILYPNEETMMNLSGEFYDNWIKLFYYRHKILWSYDQSRVFKSSIKRQFTTVRSAGDEIKETLPKRQGFDGLRNLLVTTQNNLNNYTNDLNKISFQRGTIEINLDNFKKRIERIVEQTSKITQNETDLKSLSKFSDLVTEKYLLQIQKDSEHLELGLKLLKDNINAVNSQVEIEKAESDRNFQDLVAIVGGGVAAVSFFKDSKLIKDVEWGKTTLKHFNVEIPDPLDVKISEHFKLDLWIKFIDFLPIIIIALIGASLTFWARKKWLR